MVRSASSCAVTRTGAQPPSTRGRSRLSSRRPWPGSAPGTSSSPGPSASFPTSSVCCRTSRRWASTSSTFPPSTPSATPKERAPTTGPQPRASQGVRVFRVDDPHTKPFAFWEWLIAELRSSHPDVVLLSEAFTRPKVMYRLAKAGFSQSYTYFAWRNTAYELYQYFTELAQPPIREVFRPNLWPNTPDILTACLP